MSVDDAIALPARPLELKLAVVRYIACVRLERKSLSSSAFDSLSRKVFCLEPRKRFEIELAVIMMMSHLQIFGLFLPLLGRFW